MHTLVIPPAAQRDDQAVQMLSAWVAERGLHCTLNIGHFHAQGHNEASAWGTLLADVVRHIANAMQSEHGATAEQTIQAVISALLTELDAPTSKVHGGFSPGHS
jgi:hypothetical protein